MASSAMLDGAAGPFSPDPFHDSSNASNFGCGSPLRISFGCDLPAKPSYSANFDAASGDDVGFDFDVRLDDPAAMLSADELFSDGKLVPLRLAPAADRRAENLASAADGAIRVPGSPEVRISRPDPYLFSPRAPSCAARWRDLLGLRRSRDQKAEAEKSSAAGGATTCVPIRRASNIRSLRRLLNRNAKSVPPDSAPLLRDSDSDSASSSRPSLSSSSSSGQDHDDLPRVSLDSDGTRTKQASESASQARPSPPVRLVRPQPPTTSARRNSHHEPSARSSHCPIRRSAEVAPPLPPMIVAYDSPRMNSSGKVVFHGLERSSSSPGSFTGGPRPRPRGVERSYSAHVRVKPVLNVVPLRSLRGSSKSGSSSGLVQVFSKNSGGNRSGSHGSGADRSSRDRHQVKPKDK